MVRSETSIQYYVQHNPSAHTLACGNNGEYLSRNPRRPNILIVRLYIKLAEDGLLYTGITEPAIARVGAIAQLPAHKRRVLADEFLLLCLLLRASVLYTH